MVTVLSKKYDRYELSGPVADLVGLTHVGAEAIGPGSTFYAEETGAKYLLTGAGWLADYVAAIISTLQTDIALIKAQNQAARSTSHSLAFGAADTVKTSPITYNGLNKYLHLAVPAFTNVVTATVTLVDASGRVFYTSAAKAKGASYNLETETEWKDQLVDDTLIWTVTLSGAPGGTGGTVELVPRYYGV
jgi:hypothetical protein